MDAILIEQMANLERLGLETTLGLRPQDGAKYGVEELRLIEGFDKYIQGSRRVDEEAARRKIAVKWGAHNGGSLTGRDSVGFLTDGSTPLLSGKIDPVVMAQRNNSTVFTTRAPRRYGHLGENLGQVLHVGMGAIPTRDEDYADWYQESQSHDAQMQLSRDIMFTAATLGIAPEELLFAGLAKLAFASRMLRTVETVGDFVPNRLVAPVNVGKNSRSLGQVRSMVESGSLAVSDETLSLLARLRQPSVKANVTSNSKGFVEVGPDWMDLKVMSELQRAAKSEFALVESQGTRFLIRGQNATGVLIPRAIRKAGYKDLAHTHPGTSIFSLQPSRGDISSLLTRSEIIVNEAGIAIEYLKFKENGKRLLRMWRVGDE